MNACNRETFTLWVTVAIIQTTAPYPNMFLVDSITFPVAYWITGVRFSSAIIPPTTTPGGFMLVANQRSPRLVVSDSTQAICSNVSVGAGGFTAAFDRSAVLDFHHSFVPINAGGCVSLYANAITVIGPQANNAVCQIYVVRR